MLGERPKNMTLRLSRFSLETSQLRFPGGNIRDLIRSGRSALSTAKSSVVLQPIPTHFDDRLNHGGDCFSSSVSLTPMYWPKCITRTRLSLLRPFLSVLSFVDATGYFIPLLSIVFATIGMKTPDNSEEIRRICYVRWFSEWKITTRVIRI